MVRFHQGLPVKLDTELVLCQNKKYRPIAQLAEQHSDTVQVLSSNLLIGTDYLNPPLSNSQWQLGQSAIKLSGEFTSDSKVSGEKAVIAFMWAIST